MSSPSSSTSEAKLKAEARRRRILEQSRTRIGVVSGEQPSLPNENHPDASLDINTEAFPENATIESTTINAETHTTPTTSSGLNRYAQIRRKRHASKKDADAENGGVTEENKESLTTEHVVIVADKKADELKQNQENVLSGVVIEVEKSNILEENIVGDNGDKSEVKPHESDTSICKEKKYVGVAKMRRKMLSEKKAVASTDVDVDESKFTYFKKEMEKSYKLSQRLSSQNMPLLMHLGTVWVLFLSGFSIGIQNHPLFQSQGTVNIQRNLTLVENGIGILSLLRSTSSSTSNSMPRTIIQIDDLLDSTYNSEILSSNQKESNVEKEFDENLAEKRIKPAGVDRESYNTKQSIIDPFFRVDLDKMTDGKEGILFAAARVAISIHRFFLRIFWTYPSMVIRGILTTPLAFLNPPLPIFFIYAVLIRFSTKYFLGIGPEPNLSELWEKAYKGGDSKESSSSTSSGSGIILEGSDRSKSSNFVVPDILSVGKNFVFNMIQTKFPKLTVAYGIYKDARSDMFVVLCGFFLGVVFPLHIWSTKLFASRGNDEL